MRSPEIEAAAGLADETGRSSSIILRRNVLTLIRLYRNDLPGAREAAHAAPAQLPADVAYPDRCDDRTIEAVALEADHPVADWGKLMERVQGARRVWLEAARSAAAR